MRVEIEKIRISGERVRKPELVPKKRVAVNKKPLRGCSSCRDFIPIPLANGLDGESQNGCPKSNGYWKFDCQFHKDITL